MKILSYFIILLVGVLGVTAYANNMYYVFDEGFVQINKTVITGTTMNCNNISGASYNICSGVGAGGGYSSTNFSADYYAITTRFGNNNFTSLYYDIDSRYNNENFTEQYNVNNLSIIAYIDSLNATQQDWVEAQGYGTSSINLDDYWNMSKENLGYHNITGIPTCSGTDKLTYDGTDFSCSSDVVGSGSGVGMFIDEGDYIQPNSTYASNIKVDGWMNITDSLLFINDWKINVTTTGLHFYNNGIRQAIIETDGDIIARGDFKVDATI